MTYQEVAAAGQPGGTGADSGDSVPGACEASSRRWQTGVGAAVLVLGLCMAWAAWRIPAAAAEQGAGAAWVPGLCAAALTVCGAWLIAEARRGGWRNTAAASRRAQWQITPCAWVCAGLLVNVLLMAPLGFVVASTLCYVLAVQGLRCAAQQRAGLSARGLLLDAGLGLLWSILVWAVFTRVLGVDLPVLTMAGWL